MFTMKTLTLDVDDVNFKPPGGRTMAYHHGDLTPASLDAAGVLLLPEQCWEILQVKDSLETFIGRLSERFPDPSGT